MKRRQVTSLVTASPPKRGPAAASTPAVLCEDCNQECERSSTITGGCFSVPSMKIDGISHEVCVQCALDRIRSREPVIHCKRLFEGMTITLTGGASTSRLNGIPFLALCSVNPSLSWPVSLVRAPSNKRMLLISIESRAHLFERFVHCFSETEEIRFSDIIACTRRAFSVRDSYNSGWDFARLGDPRTYEWMTRVLRDGASPLETRCLHGPGAASMYYFQIRSIVNCVLRFIDPGPLRLVFEFAELEDMKYDSRITHGKPTPLQRVVSRMMQEAKRRHDVWSTLRLTFITHRIR